MMNYEELVEKYEKDENGRKYVYINNNHPKILVSLSAFNNGDKYQSLVSLFRSTLDADYLFLTDPLNSYYLENDLGSNFLIFLEKILASYRRENIIFFGSSMAGYAAIRFAITFGAKALVCNPQVNFDITMEYAWPALVNGISKIDQTENIDNILPSLTSYIYYAFGNNILDIKNQENMSNYASVNQKIHVDFIQYDTDEHTFLFTSFTEFIGYVRAVFNTTLA